MTRINCILLCALAVPMWGQNVTTSAQPKKRMPELPLMLDCTDDPPCPEGRVCGCKDGTYHPRPYFTLDDRDGVYKFTIGLVGKWECWPSDGASLKDAPRFTVTCARKDKADAK